MNAAFQERLEQGLQLKNMTPAELSKCTGISEGAISQYRKGAYKATQRNLEKIASALGVSITWLMGVSEDCAPDLYQFPNIQPIGKGTYVPHYGRIACGAPILAIEELGEVSWKPEGVKGDFSLTCIGDSMINARIFDGDTVFLQRTNTVHNGEIAAVVVNEEYVTLKRVYYYPEENKLVLRAENPTVPDQYYQGEELNGARIIGKAVAFLSAVK